MRKWSETETCETVVNFAKLCVASEGFENHVNRLVDLRIGRNARETPILGGPMPVTSISLGKSHLRASNVPISSLRGQGVANFLSGFREDPVLIS